MAISDDGMSSSESIGFGSQIGDSFKGILTGIVLFPLSIYCIFKVETCTQAGDAFKNAKPITQKEEGKPVYITGKLTAEPVGSSFIKAGSYISVSQRSEVYAWDEEERTEGSGSNKKKVKECKLEWTSSPKDPSHFTLPGCKNKKFHKKNFKDESFSATGGKISQDGKSYSVNLGDVNFSSQVKSREPASDDIITNGYTIGDKYLFEYSECASTPREGCERIDLSVVPIPDGDMTFLGDISGDNLVKYTYKDEAFMNASVGTYEQAMQAIKSDDATMKWIMRGVCFAMMWASFVLMAGPLMTLLEFIPFVGEFGKGALNFVFGAIAFVITAVTIILVKFWYIWLLLILGGIGYAIYKRQNAAKPA